MGEESVYTITEKEYKAMKEYRVRTFWDIVKALQDNPAWLMELRRIILTEELLELPHKFDEMVKSMNKLVKRVDKIEEDVDELKKDVAELKKDVAMLKKDVAELKKDVAELKKDMKYLKGEVGRLKGNDFERRVREKYYAYVGRILRRARIIKVEDYIDMIEDAEEKGIISEEERDRLFDLDIVIKGMMRRQNKEVVLAVEVSYSLYEDDVRRAKERAMILRRILNKEVIPTVVYVENTKGIEDDEVLFISVKY
jgi:septal ring factor EnvC (AmiA/AmiB activator)